MASTKRIAANKSTTVTDQRYKRPRELDSWSAEDLEVLKTKRVKTKKSSTATEQRDNKTAMSNCSSEEDLEVRKVKRTKHSRTKKLSTLTKPLYKNQKWIELDSSSKEDSEVPQTKSDKTDNSSTVYQRDKQQKRLVIVPDPPSDNNFMLPMPRRTKPSKTKQVKATKPHIEIVDREDAFSLSSTDSADLYELEVDVNSY